MRHNSKAARYILIAVLGTAVALSLFFLLRGGAQGKTATIWTDGEQYMTIDLAEAQDGDFSIADATGHDITFRIENGRIRFLSSDCPDKICVNTGFISEENQSAVCMPNRTSITIG